MPELLGTVSLACMGTKHLKWQPDAANTLARAYADWYAHSPNPIDERKKFPDSPKGDAYKVNTNGEENFFKFLSDLETKNNPHESMLCCSCQQCEQLLQAYLTPAKRLVVKKRSRKGKSKKNKKI